MNLALKESMFLASLDNENPQPNYDGTPQCSEAFYQWDELSSFSLMRWKKGQIWGNQWSHSGVQAQKSASDLHDFDASKGWHCQHHSKELKTIKSYKFLPKLNALNNSSKLNVSTNLT